MSSYVASVVNNVCFDEQFIGKLFNTSVVIMLKEEEKPQIAGLSHWEFVDEYLNMHCSRTEITEKTKQ